MTRVESLVGELLVHKRRPSFEDTSPGKRDKNLLPQGPEHWNLQEVIIVDVKTNMRQAEE